MQSLVVGTPRGCRYLIVKEFAAPPKPIRHQPPRSGPHEVVCYPALLVWLDNVLLITTVKRSSSQRDGALISGEAVHPVRALRALHYAAEPQLICVAGLGG
jgi:hypothetical protein